MFLSWQAKTAFPLSIPLCLLIYLLAMSNKTEKPNTVKPNDELLSKLTPEQFYVTQQKGTEAHYSGEYYDHHEAGIETNPVLNEPTMQKLLQLRLTAFAAAWTEQQKNPEVNKLSFDERIGMLWQHRWSRGSRSRPPWRSSRPDCRAC